MSRPASWLRPAAILGAVAALAACSSSPPRVYTPLRYDYLLPIRLNVAEIAVEPRFLPGGPADLNAQDPSPLVPTLTRMAHDRLQAVGSAGRAVFVIKDASLTRTRDGIAGSIDVELDVYAGGGTRAAFAEAQVARRRSGDIDDMPSALYDMTKQLMDAMNIELEYQVRHSLHDWLAPSGAAPGPVQQQALPPPPGAAAAPASLAPPLAPPAAPTSLAPPLGRPLAAPAPAQMSPPPGYLGTPGSLPPPVPYPTAPYPTAPYPTAPYPTAPYPTAPYPTQLTPPAQP